MRNRNLVILFLLLALSISMLNVVSASSIAPGISKLMPQRSISEEGTSPVGTRLVQDEPECNINADMNGDGATNVVDIQAVSTADGMTSADAGWEPAMDLNNDDVIDLQDISLAAGSWRTIYAPCLELEITSPVNLSLFNTETITVSGIYTAATSPPIIMVNDIVATVDGQTFMAEIELDEGSNTITAVAQDADNHVGTASIQANLDTSPPLVVIDSPADGSVTNSAMVNVSGLINDIVVGTVNSEQAQVSINGNAAEVANRSYLATDVALQPGENVITAVGTDQAGNTANTTVMVTYEPLTDQAQISLVSGNNQSAGVGVELANPLLVYLSDGAGNPVADETVIFKVTKNNGTLTDGSNSASSLAITTNAQGQAQASWTLGTRAGAGNNMVEAVAVGYEGSATFTAIAQLGTAAKIQMDLGNNQPGMIGEPLPNPFVVVVTDEGHNRLANVPVTFSVLAGGGNFAGQPSTTISTDSDGRALAVLTLGTEVGFDNHVVEATFEGNTGQVATFVASGMVAGHPANTSISGVVLDNMDIPIEGVTVRLGDGNNESTQTDAQGQFSIQNVPVGNVHFIVDGETAQRPGEWPELMFELVTIAGRNNTIGMPIYLLELETENQLCVSESEGGTLTLPDVPGFSLSVEAGSATFENGAKEGCITVTPVHADKMPMAPQFGQQPRLAITIQPHGTLFDPPAAITMPNTDGYVPGEVTELYSFDHDLEQFVAIGTGTVSEDGTIIASDPGVGVIKAGWHCGGNPATQGDTQVTRVRIERYEPETDKYKDVGRAIFNLKEGETRKLRAFVWPSGTPIEFTWSASPEGFIQITELGEVINEEENFACSYIEITGDQITWEGPITLMARYESETGAKVNNRIRIEIK